MLWWRGIMMTGAAECAASSHTLGALGRSAACRQIHALTLIRPLLPSRSPSLSAPAVTAGDATGLLACWAGLACALLAGAVAIGGATAGEILEMLILNSAFLC